ncbi:hypothetical protein [Desmospora activa]|uniref:DUF3558 domain-containing protein n=1 Tax=Desmospora activa DSM 45169 TaxID=1121389 RepID=A0A2T4Z0G5_9BACL|nr:hypothetical protein [Desmospora activa]PTM53237.1 hypothetical protein C8J48_3548 [Desmospora activa DSM 45169]
MKFLSKFQRRAFPTKSKKIAIIRLGAVASLSVVMVLSGCSLPDFNSKNPDASEEKEASGQSETIAGPLLKQQAGEGDANSYGSVQVFDGCSVIPIKTLTDLGLNYTEQSTVTAAYLAESVPPDRAIERATPFDGVGKCIYNFGEDLVAVDVLQPPFNEERELESRMGRPERQGAELRTEQGMQVAVWQDEEEPVKWQFIIGKQDLVIDGYTKLEQSKYGKRTPEQVANAIAKQAMANISKEPIAPIQHQYDAPYDDVPDPCEVVSAEAFQQSYGEPASGYVEATYYAGDAEFKPDKGPMISRTETSCRRSNLVPSGSIGDGYQSVKVDFTIYREDEWGKYGDWPCDPKGSASSLTQPIALDMKVGDGAVCLTSTGTGNKSLNFRVGKTAVEMTNWQTQDAADPQQLAQKLEPLAQSIAENLK